MKKEKLLKALKELKVKLECRRTRFEVWQQDLDSQPITETNIRKTNMYWSKQRRLEDRIEDIQTKINNLENYKYRFQITLFRRAINEN